MGRMLWFVLGLAVGVVAAQQASRTPGGRRMLGALGGSTGEFIQTVADSYRAQQAESGVG